MLFNEDDYTLTNKKRRNFFSGELEFARKYYELPPIDTTYTEMKYDNQYYESLHKTKLMMRLIGLSILPTIMVEKMDKHIDEAYNSMYEFMISKRKRVPDMSFDYDIVNLLEIEDKILRREFNKLRKKYNSIKKTQKKIEKKEKIQKEELIKYENRHETIFLYHRLRYYDLYYMDGKLKFVNNIR